MEQNFNDELNNNGKKRNLVERIIRFVSKLLTEAPEHLIFYFVIHIPLEFLRQSLN